MIFSEIHGAYFDVVSKVITMALQKNVTQADILHITNEHAFAESILSIPQKLSEGDWPLLNKDGSTIIRNAPDMPLSNIEKRWLKTILLDPRIALFGIDGIEQINAEPLFSPSQFVYFDQYMDGDNYTDPTYIQHFRRVLKSIQEKQALRVDFTTGKGKKITWVIMPKLMEYSAVDDKFRVISLRDNGNRCSINIARILDINDFEEVFPTTQELPKVQRKTIELEIVDERDMLERCMLQLSCYTKETIKTDDNKYKVILQYLEEDETELLIRLLSFGRYVRVVSPQSLVDLMVERLQKQKKLWLG